MLLAPALQKLQLVITDSRKRGAESLSGVMFVDNASTETDIPVDVRASSWLPRARSRDHTMLLPPWPMVDKCRGLVEVASYICDILPTPRYASVVALRPVVCDQHPVTRLLEHLKVT